MATTTRTVNWAGVSMLVFDPTTTTWNDVPGVYIFTGINPSTGMWKAYYVGQADSFKNRLPQHERWQEAVRLGATHIHAAVVRVAATRAALERGLIQFAQPKLNTHHRSGLK